MSDFVVGGLKYTAGQWIVLRVDWRCEQNHLSQIPLDIFTTQLCSTSQVSFNSHPCFVKMRIKDDEDSASIDNTSQLWKWDFKSGKNRVDEVQPMMRLSGCWKQMTLLAEWFSRNVVVQMSIQAIVAWLTWNSKTLQHSELDLERWVSVCAAALTTCLPAWDPTILKLITFGRSTLDTRQYLSDYIASRENISFRFEQRKKSHYYLFPFFQSSLPSVPLLQTGCVVAHREIVSSLGLQMLFSRTLR